MARTKRAQVMGAKLKEQASTIVCGLFMCIAAILFWLHLIGNPIHEFALIQKGQTVVGSIVDTWEDAESADTGGTQWTHAAVYSYRLPDGREFTAHTKHNSGRLKNQFRDLKQPFPVEIEYLADSPQVSRIKGDGCQSISEWLWRKVGLGGVLLALFVSPGYLLLRRAICDIKRVRDGMTPPSHESSA